MQIYLSLLYCNPNRSTLTNNYAVELTSTLLNTTVVSFARLLQLRSTPVDASAMSLAEKVRRLQRHRAFEAEVVKNLRRVETLKQLAESLLDEAALAVVFAPLALRPASVASEQSRTGAAGRAAPPDEEITLGRVLATDSPLCSDWERALGDLDEVKAHVQKCVNEAIERWNRYLNSGCLSIRVFIRHS